MKILVTGGAGFIGSHTVRAFIEKGYETVVVDNLSTGSLKNIDRGNTVFYYCDVRDRDTLAYIFKNEAPDYLLHLAAQKSVINSVESPWEDAEVNIIGTINVLSVFHGKRIVFSSSGGAVYGEPLYLPVDEMHPLNPISPYGISKCCAEMYVESSKTPYTILRYANVFGLGQTNDAITIFSEKMKRGETPVIYGDGSKIRDYVHISDAVKANLLAIETGIDGIFNIGSGDPFSDRMIYDHIASYLNFEKSPEFAPFRDGEIRHIYLDCRKAEREFSWKAGDCRLLFDEVVLKE